MLVIRHMMMYTVIQDINNKCLNCDYLTWWDDECNRPRLGQPVEWRHIRPSASHSALTTTTTTMEPGDQTCYSHLWTKHTAGLLNSWEIFALSISMVWKLNNVQTEKSALDPLQLIDLAHKMPQKSFWGVAQRYTVPRIKSPGKKEGGSCLSDEWLHLLV